MEAKPVADRHRSDGYRGYLMCLREIDVISVVKTLCGRCRGRAAWLSSLHVGMHGVVDHDRRPTGAELRISMSPVDQVGS